MIIGALGNKTRIFVTHQLEILSRYFFKTFPSFALILTRVNRIVVMNNGSIAEIGTYDELMNAGAYYFNFYVNGSC